MHNLGHGAFAFIVTDSEGGSAHAWTAVNHNGTILFLDPQTRRISETVPLYQNRGRAERGKRGLDGRVGGGRRRASIHRSRSTGQASGAIPPSNQPAPRCRSPTATATTHPAKDTSPTYTGGSMPRAMERGYFDITAAGHAGGHRAVRRASAKPSRTAPNRDLLKAVESLSGFDGDGRPRLVGIEHRTKTAASLARAYALQEDKEPDLEDPSWTGRRIAFVSRSRCRSDRYEEAVSATLASLHSPRIRGGPHCQLLERKRTAQRAERHRYRSDGLP